MNEVTYLETVPGKSIAVCRFIPFSEGTEFDEPATQARDQIRRTKMSMDANSQPSLLTTKDAFGSAASGSRAVRLAVGLIITFSPLALWGLLDLVLGSDLIEKNPWRAHLDPIQIRIWLLIAAGLLELIAVFLLRKTDQKPRDWISIVSLVDTGLSILFAVYFWAQISLLIFGAT
jgi:hypothetical protein